MVSVGYPGPVLHNRPGLGTEEFGTRLGLGFDFKAAFERLIKVVNDAAMQALGSQ